MVTGGKKVILFDGVCNLCNRAVQFIIKRDKRDVFRFAALQSETGLRFVSERGIDASKVDSIILVEPQIAYYTKSEAALQIGKSLGGMWKMLGIFEWIPLSIRDWVYDRIAKNRYQWFGKRSECMVPTPDLRSKFLD